MEFTSLMIKSSSHMSVCHLLLASLPPSRPYLHLLQSGPFPFSFLLKFRETYLFFFLHTASTKKSESMGVITGIIVLVILFSITTTAVGVHFWRKRKSMRREQASYGDQSFALLPGKITSCSPSAPLPVPLSSLPLPLRLSPSAPLTPLLPIKN